MRRSERVASTRHPNVISDTRPDASTRTPSRRKRMSCVIPALDAARSRLSRPCALITRCHGTPVPSRNALSA
jgi:hypothetical protein